jgi:hypothetical protein
LNAVALVLEYFDNSFMRPDRADKLDLLKTADQRAQRKQIVLP